MQSINLTKDQQTAFDAFNGFLLDPTEPIFVLEGYSGTGKSTLVRHLLDSLPAYEKMAKALGVKSTFNQVILTATTNKAANNLSSLVPGQNVQTIHSALGLIMHYDRATNKSILTPTQQGAVLTNALIFIDEASYIDETLMNFIVTKTHECKIVFIGDPAQLLCVGASSSPVFNNDYPTAKLSKVVRQLDGCLITEVATAFRNTVNTGQFFSFKPDDKAVTYLSREDFDKAVVDEFTRPDWKESESKILAWTNKRVMDYNNGLRKMSAGTHRFKKNDYAIVNTYIKKGKTAYRTDELVMITDARHDVKRFNVKGSIYELNHTGVFFNSDVVTERKKQLQKAVKDKDSHTVQGIQESWIDLRPAFACTVNKSQGSTYDAVYIDLDDIKKCRDTNQMARMLYVAISRAKSKVVLTGDIV